MVVLNGRVITGVGNFSYWIEKLQEHYRRKTGMSLFPGTLNVLLEEEYSVPAGALRLEAEEYGGAVSVNIVPCRVLGMHPTRDTSHVMLRVRCGRARDARRCAASNVASANF